MIFILNHKSGGGVHDLPPIDTIMHSHDQHAGYLLLNVVHERRESPILGSIFHYVNLCVGYNVSF